MTSSNNIQAFREERSWSRPALAKLMNTSTQQVERLEKGQRRLTQDWIDRAATALGVSPSDIISPLDKRSPMTLPDLPPTRPSDDETVEIQQIDLSFSMGPGITIDDYIEETPVRFSIAFIRTITRAPFDRLRLAKGVGDSMFPTLVGGDVVLIDTTQRNLNMQDRVYAISLYGAAAIKRLRAVGPERVLVISDSPNVADQEVDADDIQIAGRVVWFGREL